VAASFPTTVPTTAQLYGNLVNNLSTLLDGDIGTSNTTINVDDAGSFPTTGYITIGTEAVSYTGKTATSFTGCTRGADSTTASTHSDNDAVNHYWIANHHNRSVEEMIAIAQNLSDRIGLGATQLKAVNGTVSAPAYSWANDLDSGLSRTVANTINFSTNALLRWQLDANGAWVGSSSTGIQNVAGTVTNPSYSWVTDTATGFYLPAVSNPAMAVNGVLITQWKTTGFGIPVGTVTNPGLFFNSDTNSGLVGGTDSVSFVTGGAERAFVDNARFAFSAGTVTNPSISFRADLNTGLYGGSDSISFATGGTNPAFIDSARFAVLNGTVTNPSLAFFNDLDTGAYLGATGGFYIAAAGLLAGGFDNNAVAGNTRMFVYDNDNATQERVSVGISDSGGAGYKLLRIPN